MDLDHFKTVARYTRIEIPKIKGSRFIGTVQPVADADEALTFIETLRKEFHNATHNCWAYRLGDAQDFRFNDDGEPSGTAGKPILQAIVGANLYFTAIVVTRYFGGTKLGTGGLIRAYHEAAAVVIEEAKVVTRKLFARICIHHDFDQINPVMNLVQKSTRSGTKILDTRYDSRVHLEVALFQSEAEAFMSQLTEATAGKVDCEPLGTVYY